MIISCQIDHTVVKMILRPDIQCSLPILPNPPTGCIFARIGPPGSGKTGGGYDISPPQKN
jgi:hypothetical protein